TKDERSQKTRTNAPRKQGRTLPENKDERSLKPRTNVQDPHRTLKTERSLISKNRTFTYTQKPNARYTPKAERS
ncbi:hypothetical protein VIGAN_05244800, partial [Vigna angularis var. angularis]